MKAKREFERGQWRIAFRKPRATHVCLLVLCLAIQSPAQSYKILHTFGTNAMGFNPYSTLVQGPDGVLYGTTEQGGTANKGQVFKVNPDGTGYAALKDFTGPDGAWPEEGLAISGATLYGTTGGGGTNNNGTIFKIDADGSGFTVLKHFTGYDGDSPCAKLLLIGAVLYGTTANGGAFTDGTVFKINTDGSGYAVLKHFAGNIDGAWPYGALVLSGSTLYGTVSGGGAFGNGTAFKMNTDGSGYAVLKHFTGGSDGGGPCAGLILSGVSLYGTASWGGTSGNGTVFKVNTDGSAFNVLKDLTSLEGAGSWAGLVLNGTTLYGTTSGGGSSGNGTVFKLSTDGTGFMVLKDFTNSIDGANSYAGLLLTDSTLYGSAYSGGANGGGSIFKLQTDGSDFLVLTNFGKRDGVNPVGGLLLSGTNFYGATCNGGDAEMGTIFRVNSDGSGYTLLKEFTNSLEGAYPNGDLVLSGSTLYGAAEGGSAHGVIFKINTDGTGYTVLKDFTNQLQGEYPNGSLALSENILYGTTRGGGSDGCGTVFSLNTDGSGFIVLHSFSPLVWSGATSTNADGAWPQSGLVLAGGTLYGTAWGGGTNGHGTVFKLGTDGSDLSTLKHFNSTDSDSPSGRLTFSSGTLYGTTAYGGGSWNGTIFKLNTDGSGFAVLRTFSSTDGGGLQGGLVISGPVLYGTLGWGGWAGNGTLFQLGTDGSNYLVLKHFTGSDGNSPNGGLVADGTTLFGTTASGSTSDGGVLFSLSLLPGAPEIQLQPQSQTAHLHSSVSFVVVAGGIPTPSYQWFFNGNLIDGATNGLLQLADVQGAQAGAYWAVVTNSYGSVTSVIATLTVEDPFLEYQPNSQYAKAGETVSFNVGGGGTEPLAIQWLKDGTSLTEGGNVSGAQTTTLTLTNVTGPDAGWFSVVVSNAYGSVTSVPALLVVQDPYMNTQPLDQFVNVGDAAQFSVGAAGTAPLGYQWFKDGVSLSDGGNISGAQAATLILSNASGADAGGYSVTVSNVYGNAISTVAQLAVNYATADPFDPEANGVVQALAPQADGKVLVGGGFSSLGGETRFRIGRLNTDGTVDAAFSPRVDGYLNCMAVQPDGKILVGGWFSALGGRDRNFLGRLNPNGTLDTTFNPEADAGVYCLAIQPDGKILIGGEFTLLNGQDHNHLGRLNSDGTPDTNFTCQADGVVICLALQTGGEILVGGSFTTLGGQPRDRIARLNADGTLDGSFNPEANDDVTSLAVQPDERILVGGAFTILGGQTHSRLGRLNPDGSVDSGFNPVFSGLVACLALQADGRAVAGGWFSIVNGYIRKNLARLNADGSLDNSLAPGVVGEIWALALQSDGKMLLGGQFHTVAGQPRNYLARLNSTEPATGNLTFDGTNIIWLRGGSAPEVWHTSFDVSTNGTDWLSLGEGVRTAGGWQLTGISAPTNGTLRAQGFVPGSGVSSWLVATMTGPPAITVQPQDLACPIGTMGGFCVQAGGTSPLAYQWFRNGVALNNSGNVFGAQTPTLTLSNVSGVDAGAYFVVATNLYGSVTSQVATLSVKDPYIATHPFSQSANAGANVQFSVVAVGTPLLGYQWLKNGGSLGDGGNISGAHSALLTLSNVLGGDGGGYSVLVTNAFGSITSLVATLAVVGDPFITIQPVSQSVHAGANVLFIVGAAGTAPLSYQWLKDGINLSDGGNVSGAHTPTLTLGNVLGADRGGYSVTISNAFGGVVSQSAILAVADPFIVTQPPSQTLNVWQTATLTVVVAGTEPLSYQWRKNRAALLGKTSSSLVLANAQTSDSGNYDALVDSSYGSVTSSVAVLTVNVPVTYSVLHHFTGGSDGASPRGALVLCDSTLYGTAAGYGNFGAGTIFRLNTNGTGFTVLKSFRGEDGSYPVSLLLSNSWLFGATSSGGQFWKGTIFRIRNDGSDYSMLHEFSGSDGEWPGSGLLLAGSTLFGVTQSGPSPWLGNVFKVNADGSAYAVLHSFTGTPADGNGPQDGVLLLDGTLYGTTEAGGPTGNGTVFKLNVDGTGYAMLHNFATAIPDGSYPFGGLVSSGSALYGTSRMGGMGPPWPGVIYKINADGSSFSVSKSFTGNDGQEPRSRLLLAGTELYGTTYQGGASNLGTVFTINIDGSGFRVLRDFTGEDGANPIAGLVSSDSTLFGVTFYGGSFNRGVIFSLTVPAPPSIASAPQSQTAESGGAVCLQVNASGSPALGYQWFFNGTTALSGATNSSLCLAGVHFGDAGAYTVVITNAAGAATSAPAMLQVIAPVPRRPVPAIDLIGDAGTLLNLDYANSLAPAPNWLLLDTVSLVSTSQMYFDITAPMRSERYYRTWQTGTPALRPGLNLPGIVPAIILTGNIGDHLRLDYINQIGPIDAWVTLDAITLTNTSQLYFDASMLGQPPRLYRIVPLP